MHYRVPSFFLFGPCWCTSPEKKIRFRIGFWINYWSEYQCCNYCIFVILIAWWSQSVWCYVRCLDSRLYLIKGRCAMLRANSTKFHVEKTFIIFTCSQKLIVYAYQWLSHTVLWLVSAICECKFIIMLYVFLVSKLWYSVLFARLLVAMFNFGYLYRKFQNENTL